MRINLFNLKRDIPIKQRGFSLIELTAVIGIAAATAVGFLSWTQPTTVANSTKTIETNQRMNKIANAIEAFRVQRGRLPCPADPYMTAENTRNGGGTDYYVNDFGEEDLDTDQTQVNSITTLGIDCPVRTGAVPVYSLSLPKEYILDAWGRRFTYQVSKNLCGSDAGTEAGVSDLQSTLTGCTKDDYQNGVGDIIIKDASAGNIITNTAAYVIVSHGADGAGAFLPSAEILTNGTGDQLINSNFSTTSEGDLLRRTFIKKPIISGYDDLTLFKTKIQIDRLTDHTGRKQISVAECQQNSDIIKDITGTETAFMNTNITGYANDSYNSGEQVGMGLLMAMQTMCVRYYGADSDTINGITWSGAQCPGNNNPGTNGSTYFKLNDTCTCLGGEWDGDCTMDWEAVMPVKSDLLLWFDAFMMDSVYTDSNCTTLSANSDDAACWRDKSGNGYNATITLAADTPTLNTTGINGHPSVDFDAVGDRFELSIEHAASDYTFFVTSAPDRTINGIYWETYFDSNAGAGRLLMMHYTNGSPQGRVAYTFDGSFYANDTATITGPQILSYVLDSTSGGSIYRNGTSIGTDTYNQVGISGATRIGQFYGAATGSTQYAYDGDMGEIIMFERALTATERGNIEEYLSQKWEIALP